MKTAGLLWTILGVLILGLLMVAFAGEADAQVINPPWPDSIICTEDPSGDPLAAPTHALRLESYETDLFLQYANPMGMSVLYDGTGEYVSGAADTDCEAVSVTQIMASSTATTTPRYVNYGFATTSITAITVDNTPVDNPVFNLFAAFIIFYITAGGVIWFFRKR